MHLLAPRGAELSPVRVGFSVPKKRFRQSVRRHRIRRLLAEAWRLNKQPLYLSIPAESQLHLFLIFNGDSLPTYTEVETAVIKVIQKLQDIYSRPDA